MPEVRKFDARDREAMSTGTLSEGRSKPFDRERLLRELDVKRSLIIEILDSFLEETQLDIDSLAAAFRGNNCTQVANSAHRLKGAAAAIRAEPLRAEAAQLEAYGRRGDLAGAGDCFCRLQAEFDRFRKYLSEHPLPPD